MQHCEQCAAPVNVRPCEPPRGRTRSSEQYGAKHRCEGVRGCRGASALPPACVLLRGPSWFSESVYRLEKVFRDSNSSEGVLMWGMPEGGCVVLCLSSCTVCTRSTAYTCGCCVDLCLSMTRASARGTSARVSLLARGLLDCPVVLGVKPWYRRTCPMSVRTFLRA